MIKIGEELCWITGRWHIAPHCTFFLFSAAVREFTNHIETDDKPDPFFVSFFSFFFTLLYLYYNYIIIIFLLLLYYYILFIQMFIFSKIKVLALFSLFRSLNHIKGILAHLNLKVWIVWPAWSLHVVRFSWPTLKRWTWMWCSWTWAQTASVWSLTMPKHRTQTLSCAVLNLVENIGVNNRSPPPSDKKWSNSFLIRMNLIFPNSAFLLIVIVPIPISGKCVTCYTSLWLTT